MVKFTFVSIFLTLTAMSAFVSATPIFAKYSVRISLSGTDHYLLSDGTEQAGQPVTTVTEYNPDTTLVTIIKLQRRGTTVSDVVGKAGLRVTARQPADRAPYLVWDSLATVTESPPWWKFMSRFPEQGYFVRDTRDVGLDLAWVIGPNEDLVLNHGAGDIFTIQAPI